MMHKTVLICCTKLSDRAISLGYLWNSIGVPTVLAYCQPNPIYNSGLGIFSAVFLCKSAGEIIALADRLESFIVHYTNFCPDDLGAHLYRRNIPYIYDYKDLFAGVRSRRLGMEFVEHEIAIYSKAIAYTPRDNQYLCFEKSNQIKHDKPILIVPDFPISNSADENWKSNLEGRPRIFMSGGAPKDRQSCIEYCGISLVVKALLESNLEVTVFGFSSNPNATADNHDDSLLAQLAKEHQGKLFLHEPAPHSDFLRVAAKHDFAVHFLNHEFGPWDVDSEGNSHDPTPVGLYGSTRVYSYLTAGLPVLLSSTFKFTIELFKNNRWIIPVGEDEVKNLGQTLSLLHALGYRELLDWDSRVPTLKLVTEQFKQFASEIDKCQSE